MKLIKDVPDSHMQEGYAVLLRELECRRRLSWQASRLQQWHIQGITSGGTEHGRLKEREWKQEVRHREANILKMRP